MPQETVSPEAMELVRIYRDADPDFKEIIFKMLVLAGKWGTPFLQETEKPCLSGDRKAIWEIFRKWEAKGDPEPGKEGACA